MCCAADHGQSQEATFRQRHGETLHQLIDRISTPDDGFAGIDGDLVVVSSGNLALLYLTGTPHRATREQIDQTYPKLISGLTTHPGVGLVIVDDDGPVALGIAGSHRLLDGTVEGLDPLLPYGPHARGDLLRHQEAAHVGDLVLISAVDPVTQEVAAFEELVGSHGGLGGRQTDAVLVSPSDWPITEGEINGSDAMYRQLMRWLRRLELRGPDDMPALQQGSPIHLNDLSRHLSAG